MRLALRMLRPVSRANDNPVSSITWVCFAKIKIRKMIRITIAKRKYSVAQLLQSNYVGSS